MCIVARSTSASLSPHHLSYNCICIIGQNFHYLFYCADIWHVVIPIKVLHCYELKPDKVYMNRVHNGCLPFVDMYNNT